MIEGRYGTKKKKKKGGGSMLAMLAMLGPGAVGAGPSIVIDRGCVTMGPDDALRWAGSTPVNHAISSAFSMKNLARDEASMH